MNNWAIQDYIGIFGLCIPIALMILAYFLLKNHSLSIERKISEHGQSSNKTMSESLALLINSVSPRIVYCPDTPALAEECITMIVKAVDDFRKHRIEIESGASTNTADSKKDTISFINIYGAANIDKPERKNKKAINHHDKFHAALDRAMQSGLRVQRYINLPKTEFFDIRSMAKKIEFHDWIDHEIEIIKKSSNYDMILNPRAPGWEGAATMATNSGIVEIKGGGKSGIAIYDSALSASIRFSVRKDLEGANENNQNTVNSHKNLHLLEEIRDEMKALVSGK